MGRADFLLDFFWENTVGRVPSKVEQVERLISLAELLGNEHQIKDIGGTIVIDINETSSCDIDFAIKIGEPVGDGRSVVSPIGYRGSR